MQSCFMDEFAGQDIQGAQSRTAGARQRGDDCRRQLAKSRAVAIVYAPFSCFWNLTILSWGSKTYRQAEQTVLVGLR